MSKTTTDQQSWAKLSGVILGKITAVWFALTLSALILVVPTKCLFSLVKWFWQLW